MSRFTTETKRKPRLDLVLVVLFTNIDSSVCLAANNNVGSKMFNKNAIFVSYQLPLWIFIMREVNVETWEIKNEVNVINLNQSLILGLAWWFFLFFLENKPTNDRFSNSNKNLNQPKQPKKGILSTFS